MSRNIENYPPVGDPNRLDEIMQRGAGMRRRRRVLGASSAGIMGVACLALVLALGRGAGPATQEVATSPDDGSAQQSPSPGVTTGNTTVTEHSRIDYEPLSVDIDESAGQIRIFLNDPRTPSPVDPSLVVNSSLTTQQCVLVSVESATDDPGRTFEAHACREIVMGNPSSTMQTVMEPRDATDVTIGCAAVEERLDGPIEMTTMSAATEFVATFDSFGVTSGDYVVTVTGVSGFGDGCPDGSGDPGTSEPGGATDPTDPGDAGDIDAGDSDAMLDPDSPQRENVEKTVRQFTIGA